MNKYDEVVLVERHPPGEIEKKITALERSTWIMEHLSPSSCIGDVGDADGDGRFVRSG